MKTLSSMMTDFVNANDVAKVRCLWVCALDCLGEDDCNCDLPVMGGDLMRSTDAEVLAGAVEEMRSFEKYYPASAARVPQEYEDQYGEM